jgi:5-methylcytosine-specific restriction endonuclease McrA
LLQRGEEFPIPRPEPMTNPRRTKGARTFRTVGRIGADAIPYEFEGFGPRAGDMVERHGEVTSYAWYRPEQLEQVPEYAPHGFHVASHASGSMLTVAATETGEGSRVVYGQFALTGTKVPAYSAFNVDGVSLIWIHEIIRDLAEDGREYTWEANVCVPVSAHHPGTLWSPAYTKRSRISKRATAAIARHQRRLRTETAMAERFDPHEVFERDNWICGLCHTAVNPELTWPDPLSPSLDHVIPLAAGGPHSQANAQLAHWICNVRKGARAG